MNALHHIIELVLPYMISVLEIIGIIIVFWSGVYEFWQYLKSILTGNEVDVHSDLAHGLAMGLEFKMGAEILRTVLIQSLNELYMLGAVILLRALLSFLIHYELKHSKKDKTSEKKSESEK